MDNEPYKPPRTWRDHVRDYWPEATDDQCNEVLREHTSWPLAGPDELKQQLAEYMSFLGKARRSNE